MIKKIKGLIRYCRGQVSSIYMHPLNNRTKRRVWYDFICDQVSARLAGPQRPQVCSFFEETSLALTTYTAPGIHYSRVGCMHDYEELSLFVEALAPGDTFLDVGANAGSFSIAAISRGCSRVIAFEPSPKTNWITRLNFRINNANPLLHDVRSQAVGKQIGMAPITTHLGGTDRLLLPHELSSHPEAHTVEVITLDSLDLLSSLNPETLLAVKVDVEGFDFDVLQGAKETLRCAKMALLCIEANSNKTEIKEFLQSIGFEQFRYDPLKKVITKLEQFTPNCNGLFAKSLEIISTRISSSAP